MNNKAQATAFIILGLLVIIILLLLFSLTGLNPIMHTTSSAQEAEQSLNFCLESMIDEALIMIGRQGGQINPTNFILLNSTRVSYNLPSLEAMEKELEEYFSTQAIKCLPKNTNSSRAYSHVKLGNKATVNFDWKVAYTEENGIYELDIYEYENDINFEELYKALGEVRLGYKPGTKNLMLKKENFGESVVYLIKMNDYVFLTAVKL